MLIGMTEILFTHVEVEGHLVDVRVSHGRIAEIGQSLVHHSTDAHHVAGRGGALLPGLHDHHLHLLSMAAALRSVDLSRTDRDWTDLLRNATPDSSGWIRAVGHQDPTQSGLDRSALDHVRADVPVRVQHRGGALWTMNSLALQVLSDRAGAVEHEGVERDTTGRWTGRIWRRDDLIRTAVGAALPDLAPVQRRLRAFGITGVTDASPDLAAPAVDHLVRSLSTGTDKLRLMLMATGKGGTITTWAAVGPRKIVLHDHNLPTPQAIEDKIRSAHAAGRPVAVHCVTRQALVLTLAAFDSAGTMPGDRVEHGSVVPPELADWLARLKVRVVTQPLLVHDRGDDYLAMTEPPDLPHLYPYGDLLDRGVLVAPSSDAPYASPDPWAAMKSADTRLSRAGRRVGADRTVAPKVVLSGYLSPLDDPGGAPRRVCVNAPADLCLLHLPLAAALHEGSADVVRESWLE